MKKNYSNDILEKAYIIWLFHNEKIRKEHLQSTLPAMFLNSDRRLIVYAMQLMDDRKIEITVPNIVLFLQNNEKALAPFIKKHKARLIAEDKLNDLLFDMEITEDSSLFDTAKEWLIVHAFARFVEDRMTDMNYYNGYPGQYENHILAASKGIIKVHGMLRGRLVSTRDQLGEAQELINTDDEYISTSSQVLNSYIGGWTRGYVGSLIAKSGHTKSSWIDYDTCHSLLSDKISKAVILSPEESAGTRWRRIIAMVLKISTSQMRQKIVCITNEQVERVRQLFKDKLIINDEATKYKDIIDAMQSFKCDKLVIDHLQSIEYPGKGGHLANMIQNIPGLIDQQKRIAKAGHMAIINLSQVGDKEIQRSDRLSKAPRYYDAYGSSALIQASREFLALYYPMRDYEDNPIMFGANPPSVNDTIISIEKSSFSRIGKVKLNFNPEFNLFEDKPTKSLDKSSYVPPKEKGLDQLGMF